MKRQRAGVPWTVGDCVILAGIALATMALLLVIASA